MATETAQKTPTTLLSNSRVNKIEMTEAIISAKISKGMSWEEIAEQVGVGVVWLTSACLGKNSAPPDIAEKICSVLGLPSEVGLALQTFPHKAWEKEVPQVPVIYRLYELIGVYGDTIKEIIHEKFGDGIMSAIDFSMNIDKQENPAGDRVVITLNGKFLPYRTW